MSRAPVAVLAFALASLALAPPAGAVDASFLWSTVNVCDTPKRPDRVGIRGSMPGTGKSGEMFMRFRLQFYDQTKKRWKTVRGDVADSGFVSVGSSKWKRRQTGWSVRIRPPEGGGFVVRGVVYFEWRRKGRVVKRSRRITEDDRRSVAGADPPGFSAAECEIS